MYIINCKQGGVINVKKKFITRRFVRIATLALCLSTSMMLGTSCQAAEQTKENTASITQAEVKEDYMDIAEKLIQPVAENSIFEKRADTAYGTVQKLTYYSQTAGRDTPVNVILPPNYSADKEYHVLYILHGFTDTQDWMLRDDVALVNMLGNLTSDGEIKEMIVVLPYIFCDKTQQFVNGFDISASPAYDNFINDLKTDLLDFINSSFPIKQGRENAAITGFSMGGRESLFIGVQMSDVFGYVGAACPAPGLTPVANSPMHPGQLTEDELTYDASKGVPYLTFITKGENDNVVGDSPLSYHNLLTANGNKNLFHTVPLGSHNASSVKQHLYNFTRMIFAVEESHYDDISFNDLTADENNITLTVTNDGTSQKACAFAAYYDKNDKLVNVSINKNTELKNGENTIQLENKSVGSYIKAYLWSGIDKMIPIASPKTVNQINTSVFPANEFEALPLSYYDKTENGGRVEVLTYKTQDYLTNSGEMEKRAFVYLPSGYDKSKKYNVLYLLHGGNDSELWYFTNAGQASNYENVDFSTYDFSGSDLKNILDHITSSGEAEPFIVCTPTYQTPYDTTQMESIKIFHKELTNDLIPSLESKYSTYYDGSDITKSRMHRAFGGFSLGSAVTWNVFAGSLDSVGWFMPVSGDCWHLGMGSGKTNTMQTVDYLQSVVQNSGMTYKDFYIYGGCGNSSDVAYPNMIPQLEEMKSRTDGVFKYCDNFAEGNFFYCINPYNGHTIETVYNTLYNALPKFFKGIREV